MCASDLRVDGMFSVVPSVYDTLRRFYSDSPICIVWGLQHSYPFRSLTWRFFAKTYLSYLITGMAKMTESGDLTRLSRMLLRWLRAGDTIDSYKIPVEQRLAVASKLVRFIRNASSPDALSKISVIVGGNGRKKEWSMERQRIGMVFYPNARNAFPFYDRTFQEYLISMPLKERYGGFIPLLMKGPISYKNIVIKSIEKNIPPHFLLGGTQEALSSWHSLYRQKGVFEIFNGVATDLKNKALIDFIRNEFSVKFPSTFEEYLSLNTLEVERISVAVFIAVHFQENNIHFSI